ncbi:MAG: major capsid protein [Magnetococcales bacterium]|nr:major capsid protein [Magnetococcales bacterium]
MTDIVLETDLFKPVALTTAVNAFKPAESLVYSDLFAPRLHTADSETLLFDVLTGSEGILPNIRNHAPATVNDKTGRRAITMTAPRVAEKRQILTADLLRVRSYGSIATMMMMDRINYELRDMTNDVFRTLEYWSCGALRGKILDVDGTTTLIDFNVPDTHNLTLTSTDKWSDADSDPIGNLESWKQTVQEDTAGVINEWRCYCGFRVMNALLKNPSVQDKFKYTAGTQMAVSGDIPQLAGVTMLRHGGSFLDSNKVRRHYIDPDEIILVGLGNDTVDCMAAPIVDEDAQQGIGNIIVDTEGKFQPQVFYAKSWKEEDPSARWIKIEARVLPILRRPTSVLHAKVQ